MERYITFKKYRFSHTDIVRFSVIVSLTLSCILLTFISLERHVETIYAQLFYFPILYTTYFYPRKGIIVAGISAVAYEIIVYGHLFPDAIPLWSATGQAVLFVCVAAIIGYFIDKIKISEARYRSIFENSLLGIVLFDKNTFFISLTNQQLDQMLGYTSEELKKLPFSSLFITPEEQRRFFGELGSSEDIRNFETCFVTKNKEPCWVNLSWSRIDGSIISCSVIDINARLLAQAQAEDNATRYRQVTESTPTSILIVKDTRITFVNPAFSAFSGYSPEETIGNELAGFILPEDKEQFLTFSGSWTGPNPVADRAEFRFVSKTGETRNGMVYFTPIQMKDEPAGLLNIIDHTDWERLKESVQISNERRRGMISTVAQELRTPLQPIMGYLNLLMQDPNAFGITEETRQILERCMKSVDRERQIINQMLEISVVDTGETELIYSVFPLREMVTRIIKEGAYSGKAEITLDVPEDLTFEADEDKIFMVIDVMLANAIAYSKSPKKIWITYRGAVAHPFHRLAIQDNGVGITEAQLDEIFEPAHAGDGQKPGRKTEPLGFSLSIAKKYIQMHGGYISVDSIVNIGSTFTIHIPKKRPPGAKSHEG